MRYFVTVGDRTLEVELGGGGVRVEGESVGTDLVELDGTDVFSLLLDGVSHRIVAARRGRGVWRLHLGGFRLDVEVVDERTRRIREVVGSGGAGSGLRPLEAPMPGLVLKVEVAEGDVVRPDQGVVIVEAMKMENELRAEAEGRVRRVLVAPGDAVERGQVLVEFEPVEDTG